MNPILVVASALAAAGGVVGYSKLRFPLRVGCCVTAYSPDGSLVNAVGRARPILQQVKPDIVQLHAHYQGAGAVADAIRNARSIVPGVRVWLGIACDPAMHDEGRGAITTAAQGIEAGCESVVFNAEAAFKRNKAAGARIAQAIVKGTKARFPRIPLGHTAYARPNVHMDYPWSAWLGGRDNTGTYDVGCDYSLPQVYPYSGHRTTMVPAGVFRSTYAQHVAAWRIATSSGLIHDSPVGIYVQAEWIPEAEMVDVIKNIAVQAFWPMDDGFSGWDAHGTAAAKQLSGRWWRL